MAERDQLVAGAPAEQTDALTGLGTRGYLDTVVPLICAQCDARGLALSVLVIRVDAGPDGGAVPGTVLAAVAGVCRASLRGSDIVVRSGDAELMAVLIDGELEIAARVAERVRRGVAKLDAAAAGSDAGSQVTVSIGGAGRQERETPAGLVGRAEQALERARAGGRDQVELDSWEMQ